MYLKNQLHSLEIMYCERAAAAKKEMNFWLAEADEWASDHRAIMGANH
jgi:hypothetical protein